VLPGSSLDSSRLTAKVISSFLSTPQNRDPISSLTFAALPPMAPSPGSQATVRHPPAIRQWTMRANALSISPYSALAE
jgi:hypothetical protein